MGRRLGSLLEKSWHEQLPRGTTVANYAPLTLPAVSFAFRRESLSKRLPLLEKGFLEYEVADLPNPLVVASLREYMNKKVPTQRMKGTKKGKEQFLEP